MKTTVEKYTEFLKALKDDCERGLKIKSSVITKKHDVTEMSLTLARKLGYIKKVGSFLYVWKVGDVMPVMGKALLTASNEYHTKSRNKPKCDTAEEIHKFGMAQLSGVKAPEDVFIPIEEYDSLSERLAKAMNEANKWKRSYEISVERETSHRNELDKLRFSPRVIRFLGVPIIKIS